MLALVVVPDTLQFFSVGKARDVDASITSSRETLHLAVFALQAVIAPTLEQNPPIDLGNRGVVAAAAESQVRA